MSYASIRNGYRYDPIGLKPEILDAKPIIAQVYQEFHRPVIWTAGVNGSHSRNSIHYMGLALDVWTSPDWSDGKDITGIIRVRLGERYDVVYENDHIHIEYQPHAGVNLEE